jgi:Domain of unknown function (DUF4440)
MKVLICAMAMVPLWAVSTAHAGDLTSRWASSSDPADKTITALEDMWAHTSCSSVPPALKAAFADNFQGTAPNGQRYGRPKHWEGRGDNVDCKLEKIQIRVFGDSVAIAYGDESSISKKNGKELKHCLAWTDTWLKRNGQWQILAAQDNLVTCQLH